MAHVMVLDSLSEDIFVCGPCKIIFNSLPVFLDHKRLQCTKEIPVDHLQHIHTYTPYETSAKTNDEPIQDVLHTQKQSFDKDIPGAEELTCPICKKQFKKKNILDGHVKTHFEKSYQCPVCGRCFVRNSNLQRHILSHKVWPDGITETTAKSFNADLTSYSCSYCSLVYSNYVQFRSHLKIHLTFKKFKCIQSQCMEFFDSLENLMMHIASTHSICKYKCHICCELFSSLESIAAHQQAHDELKNESLPKEYKCSQCDAVFRKAEKLSLHLLTESHKKVCIYCNKTFASDKRLRMHLQTHRTSKPFQCTICSSSFHMKKYLSAHMLKHGKSIHKCPSCKSMFKRSDLLQRHMRLHLTKKLLECPYRDVLNCKKEFSRKDKLKDHIKCHKNNLPVKTCEAQ